jgi:hypothetical protein
MVMMHNRIVKMGPLLLVRGFVRIDGRVHAALLEQQREVQTRDSRADDPKVAHAAFSDGSTRSQAPPPAVIESNVTASRAFECDIR